MSYISNKYGSSIFERENWHKVPWTVSRFNVKIIMKYRDGFAF